MTKMSFLANTTPARSVTVKQSVSGRAGRSRGSKEPLVLLQLGGKGGGGCDSPDHSERSGTLRGEKRGFQGPTFLPLFRRRKKSVPYLAEDTISIKASTVGFPSPIGVQHVPFRRAADTRSSNCACISASLAYARTSVPKLKQARTAMPSPIGVSLPAGNT